ncbi:MAG: hypothetical protein C4K58_07525 [Flavobacteriaceae bacterium]|nr:MAG: hypothetical protein C4K58_07525 [Flavobacteriaceae bacterium]
MANTKKVEDNKVELTLRALYDLQLIDSRLDEIRNTRGELPLEVSDLEDEIEGLNTRVEKINLEIEELQLDIKAKGEQIVASGELIKKYTSQQDNVRNNREFEALTKEIEYQDLEIQLAEKKIKEAGAKIEQKKLIIEEIQQKLASNAEHLSHKKQELEVLVEETRKEEEELQAKTLEFSSQIEERLLRAYTRIRSNVRNGLAVVSIDRGASSGSFFTIPPQRQIEIANRKKIIVDEHSGRILVDAELANEEYEKMKSIIK